MEKGVIASFLILDTEVYTGDCVIVSWTINMEDIIVKCVCRVLDFMPYLESLGGDVACLVCMPTALGLIPSTA